MTTDLINMIFTLDIFPLIDSQSTLAIAALTGLTLLTLAIGSTLVIRTHQARLNLLRRMQGNPQAPTGSSPDWYAGGLQWLFKMLELAGKTNIPSSEKKRSMVRQSLITAGYRHPDAPIIFFGIRVYLALLVPAIYSILDALTPYSLPTSAFSLVVLALSGLYIPNLWVKLRTRYRRQKIFSGFPDALDLLVICVEASLSLDAAIQRIADEFYLTNRVVSDELKLLALGLRAGQSRQVALLGLSRRIDVQEVSNFVDIMIQTEQFGTSVAQSLRVQADAMRLKKRLFAEEKASELPVKLLFPLLFFIFPSMLLIILGPGLIRLMNVLSHLITSAPPS